MSDVEVRMRKGAMVVVGLWAALSSSLPCTLSCTPSSPTPDAHMVVDAGTRTPAPPKAVEASLVTLQGETMGSTWHVKLVARDDVEAKRAEDLLPTIDALLEQINNEISTWRPASEVSRFNASKSTTPFPVSPELAALVQRALDVGALTDGAYDVTIGPLLDVWGFDAKGRRTTPPPASEVQKAKERVGYHRLHVVNNTLVKARADLVLNVTSVGDGTACDRVFALLRKNGFERVLVEVAGEVRANGNNIDGKPWSVGVNVPKPEAAADDVVLAVPLHDLSLSTSGTYRNNFVSGGRRYSHILDPATGAPVTHDLASATVTYPDCMMADALSTAAIAMGEERFRAVLAKVPGAEALFIHVDDKGHLHMTRTAGFPAKLPEEEPATRP